MCPAIRSRRHCWNCARSSRIYLVPTYPRRVLLDACLSPQLSQLFPEDFEVADARAKGWHKMKNGELTEIAAESGYEAIVTKDRAFYRKRGVQPFPFPVFLIIPPEGYDTVSYHKQVMPAIIGDMLSGVEKQHYSYGEELPGLESVHKTISP